MGEHIAVVNGGVVQPFVHAWPFDGSFGTKHSDPSPTAIPAAAHDPAFSPDAAYIGIGHNTTPFVTVYNWSDGGFGAKVTNPAPLPPAAVNGIAWRPQGDYVAMAHVGGPFVTVYNWSGGFGSKVPNPGTLPLGNAESVAWSADGLFLAVGLAAPPRIIVYPFNPAGSGSFGSPVADPIGGPTAVVQGIAFAADDSYIAMGSGLSPFIHVFPWTGVFGTKVADPATLPLSFGQQVAWDDDDSHLLIAMNAAPFVRGYPFTKAAGGSFGAVIANPSPALPGITQGVRFNNTGAYVAFGSFGAPRVSIYNWSGSAFGAKVADPAVGPNSNVSHVAFGGSFAPPPPAGATLSGSVLTPPLPTEEDIRTGGRTVIATIDGDTLDAGIGSDNAQTQDLINGLLSAGAGPLAWNAKVVPFLNFDDVTRDSDTQVTVLLPAVGDYDIDFDETIEWTIPASALAGSVPLVASPTFTITVVFGGGGDPTTGFGITRGQQAVEKSLIQIRDLLAGLGQNATRGIQAKEKSALQVLDILRGGDGTGIRGQQSWERTLQQIEDELLGISRGSSQSAEATAIKLRRLAQLGAFE